MSNNKVSLILRIICILLLFLALFSHPYSYYIVLRWVVSFSSLFVGYISSRVENHTWAWVYFIIAVLFNPILPIYLSRNTWQIFDVIVAIIFIYSFFSKGKDNVA